MIMCQALKGVPMNLSYCLEQLKSSDIYSLMLFVLFKLKDSEKYASLSELAYIFDKESLLDFCQYYGGTTITVPTISELELVLNGLLLFQEVDLNHKDLTEELSKFDLRKNSKEQLISTYKEIKRVLENYRFSI